MAQWRMVPIAIGMWLIQAAYLSGLISGAAVAAVVAAAAAIAVAARYLPVCRPKTPRATLCRDQGLRGESDVPGPVFWSTLGRVAQPLGMLAVALAAGAAIATLRALPLTAEPIPDLISAHAVVTAQMRLDSPPQLRQGSAPAWAQDAGPQEIAWQAEATVTDIREGNQSWQLAVPVIVKGTADDLSRLRTFIPGSRYELTAAVAPSDFDRSAAFVLAARSDLHLRSPPPLWQQIAHDIRAGLADSSAGLASDPAGLLPGLVVGDESGLDPTLREDMRRSGLGHLTAVSGANLAIVSGAVLLLARFFRCGRRISVLLAGIAMGAFVLVAGPQPSVVRAAAMGGLSLVVLASARQRAPVALLSSAVVLLLLIDPWLSISFGFALSVAATAGLIGFAHYIRTLPPLADTGISRRELAVARAKRYLGLGLGVAASAQLATAPLIAAMGAGVPVVGVIANLAAEPAVPFATIAGCIAALAAVVAPALGPPIAAVAGYPAGWVAQVARWSNESPIVVVPWPDAWLGFASMSLVCLALLAAVLGRNKIAQSMPPTPIPQLAIAVVLAIVVAGATRPARPGWPPPDWLLVMCDVGQGDALAVNAGEGHAIVIDVGPEPEAVDRCLTELNVTAIDVLMLTHFHADHVGGLTGAIEGRALGRVIGSPLNEPPAQAGAVQAALRERGIAVEAARPGEQTTLGDVEINILGPAILTSQGSAPNNASIAAGITTNGVTTLFTGDVERETQNQLATNAQAPKIDIVKVPHHGSRNFSQTFVAWVGSPQLALISVGASNRYGHPAGQTINAWQLQGAQVERTDTSGDVAVVKTNTDQLAVVRSRAP